MGIEFEVISQTNPLEHIRPHGVFSKFQVPLLSGPAKLQNFVGDSRRGGAKRRGGSRHTAFFFVIPPSSSSYRRRPVSSFAHIAQNLCHSFHSSYRRRAVSSWHHRCQLVSFGIHYASLLSQTGFRPPPE